MDQMLQSTKVHPIPGSLAEMVGTEKENPNMSMIYRLSTWHKWNL